MEFLKNMFKTVKSGRDIPCVSLCGMKGSNRTSLLVSFENPLKKALGQGSSFENPLKSSSGLGSAPHMQPHYCIFIDSWCSGVIVSILTADVQGLSCLYCRMVCTG